MAKNRADLTSDNDDNVVTQTAPESITPDTLGTNVIQEVIDSMWNVVDDLLTLPPKDVTKAELATAIGASSLNLRTNGFSIRQWLKITDRTDGFPLYVQINGTNTISPFGIWVKSSKPLAVIMDYAGGYQGETSPFIAMFDENRNLNLSDQIIIADSSKGAGKVLVSDTDGKGTWTDLTPASYQGGVLDPGTISGASALMLGLAGSITPTKTGKVLIIISAEYVSDDTATNTNFVIKAGTGTAPSNGDSATGISQLITSRLASSTTLRIPICLSVVADLSANKNVANWIDLATCNNSAGDVTLFNVVISAIEQ